MGAKSVQQWTLRKTNPTKDYPCTEYFWVSPEGLVAYQRAITPLGFLPISIGDFVGLPCPKGTKKVNSKGTQEQLSKGWLVL